MKSFLFGIFFIILYTSSNAQVTKVIVGGFAGDSLHNKDVRLSFLEGYQSYNGEAFPGIVDVGMGSVLETYDYASTNGYQMLIVSYAFPPSYWAMQAPYYPDVMGCFPAGSNQHILRFDDSIATLPPNIIITGAGDTINMTAYKLNFFDIDPLSVNNASSFSNGYIAGKLAYIMNHSQAVNPTWEEINDVCTQTSSRNGIWDLDDGYGTIDVDNALNAILPVELVSFSASTIGNDIELIWETSTEVDNYGFEVHRKAQNSEWQDIGFVEGHGNSNSPKFYSYTDDNPIANSILYYRLKQIDTDGSFEYSDIVEVEIELPAAFELYQNYPNPFNPTTTISYSLSKEALVNLIIYNALGEEVAILINEEKYPGNYEVKFDAGGLSSGIYFYRLQVGDLHIRQEGFVSTRKMILLE